MKLTHRSESLPDSVQFLVTITVFLSDNKNNKNISYCKTITLKCYDPLFRWHAGFCVGNFCFVNFHQKEAP